MKKYIFLSLTGLACLLLVLNLTSFKNSEKSTKNVAPYVLMEIYEVPAYDDKGVHIHWGGGKTEVIPFKDFVAHNHDENGEIILQSINKVAAQGYQISHVTGGLGDRSGMITKLFFQKAE